MSAPGPEMQESPESIGPAMAARSQKIEVQILIRLASVSSFGRWWLPLVRPLSSRLDHVFYFLPTE